MAFSKTAFFALLALHAATAYSSVTAQLKFFTRRDDQVPYGNIPTTTQVTFENTGEKAVKITNIRGNITYAGGEIIDQANFNPGWVVQAGEKGSARYPISFVPSRPMPPRPFTAHLHIVATVDDDKESRIKYTIEVANRDIEIVDKEIARRIAEKESKERENRDRASRGRA